MKKFTFYAAKTILALFVLNSCNSEEIVQTSEIEAKDWFTDHVTSKNFEVLNYIQNIEWDKAIISNGDKGEIIEVPFTVQSDLKTNIGDQNYKTYHRLLLKKSGNSFTYNHVQIITLDAHFDNTDKNFNFYQITDNFDGIIVVVNQNKQAIQFSDFKDSISKEPDVTSKATYPKCIYMGWLYDDGRFESLMLIGCFDGGGGLSNENGGYPSHVGSGGVKAGSTSQTFTILPSGPKVDPKNENACFDLDKSAELTIYVQQGEEGTRTLVGSNQVGHVFIGLKQNGIERYYGFYPKSGASSAAVAVGKNYNSELRDNSKELYHVSISKSVSADQLKSIVKYANGYPDTYNVNSYACTDFGIAIGKLGGINLPSTKSSSWAFSGTSPGNLGEDIRSGSFPNTTKTLVKSNAPQKKGSCQ